MINFAKLHANLPSMHYHLHDFKIYFYIGQKKIITSKISEIF
jgi:hypothetical protein